MGSGCSCGLDRSFSSACYWRSIEDAHAERYLTVRDERNEARAERDRAEGVLLALITQLLPGEEKPVYLYSTGIRELDRGQLNATLARHGLRIRSKATFSERLVATRLDKDRVVGHTQFWLEKATAEADDQDHGAKA